MQWKKSVTRGDYLPENFARLLKNGNLKLVRQHMNRFEKIDTVAELLDHEDLYWKPFLLL